MGIGSVFEQIQSVIPFFNTQLILYKLSKIFFLVLSLSLIGGLGLEAQAYKKGFKALEKSDWNGARTVFESLLGKDSERPVAEVGLGQLHANPKFEEYDLKKAYEYYGSALASLKKLDAKTKSKLQEAGYGNMSIAKMRSGIVDKAYEEAKKTNTSSAYGDFLKNYPDASKVQIDNGTKLRDLRGVEEAEKSGKYASFEDWYRRSHESALKLAPETAIRGEKGMLEAFVRQNGWQSFGEFAGTYPDNVYVKDQAAAQAFVQAAIKNQIAEYRGFINRYGQSPFVKIAADSLCSLMLTQGKVDEYDFFVRNYAAHPRINEVWQAFYKAFIEGNGINSVFQFEQNYPGFPFKDQLEKDKTEARKKGELPLFEKTRASRNLQSHLDFIAHYSGSPYLPDLEDSFFELLQQGTPNPRAFALFVQTYPQSKHLQTVLGWLFEQYASDGEWSSLDLFEERYPAFEDKARLQAERVLARKGLELHLERPFDSRNRSLYEAYIEQAAPRALAFVALQRYMERDITSGNYPAALAKLERFAPGFGTGHYELEQLRALLKAVEPQEDLERTAFPPAINTNTSEYVPLMTADGESLYFCRYIVHDMSEDIYVSQRRDGVWQPAEQVKDLSNRRNNEGPMALSADGNTMILFVEGNLYSAERTATGWSAPMPLPPIINSEYWDADAALSADGKALVFISHRPGAKGIHRSRWKTHYHGDNFGNCDLFVSLRDENGAWREPINLGPTVNTPFSERSPFLHYDLKTLYFSSDGHGGLGRMDVYKTERLDDSWTRWSTPVNLGKNINTAGNDWGYKISTDGSKIYYSAARNNATDNEQNMDIFEMKLPERARPQSVCIVSGRVVDAQGAPVAAQVIWEDLATGQKIGELKSNPQNGNFFLVLPEGKNYGYYLHKEGYLPQADNIDLRSLKCPLTIDKQIQLTNLTEMVEKDIALPLKNLFFDTNKFELKPESFPELNRLMDYVRLAQQQGYRLEIAGHTDSQGSDRDNLTLSRNRARSVREYLISKGCPPDMIRSEGYGESKPVADNESEAGRALNRRVEVRFYK